MVLVTGDAYVDHPSFGAALIGRVLEAAGFRVGILAQPSWTSANSFRQLGRPRLFFGVTAGNLDSMVSHYTAHHRRRGDDAFSPGGRFGLRPDRAATVYAHRCREAFSGVPVILGGLEASLRRLAHYDWWDNRVRRSILFDAKADLLVYGQAEKTIVEIANRISAGIDTKLMHDIPGIAFICKDQQAITSCWADLQRETLVLPSFEEISADRHAYARFAGLYHQEHNPLNARLLMQRYADRWLVVTPPRPALSSSELDAVYALPYARNPHPSYGDSKIPAWESIRLSVQIVRGCGGGCSFCSLTQHQGRDVSSRSLPSIVAEVQVIQKMNYFRGTISDLGGPTANLWQMGCNNSLAHSRCKRSSCLYPTICKNFQIKHDSLISLYKKVRGIPGVRHVFVASGLRYDVIHADSQFGESYLKELVSHHVSGQLKVAPEHVSSKVLGTMHKPGLNEFEWFRAKFEHYSNEAKKEQYLVPYFVSSHPGCSLRDAAELSDYLRTHRWKPQQVQDFMPTPMTLATDMFHTGLDPLTMKSVEITRDMNEKKAQKALMRWADPQLKPWLDQARLRLGRSSRQAKSKGEKK